MGFSKQEFNENEDLVSIEEEEPEDLGDDFEMQDDELILDEE